MSIIQFNSSLYSIKLLKNYIQNLPEFFHIRRKPHTIQLPITSRCNSRCVTCNVWKLKDHKDIDYNQLEKLLSDKYFSKVKSVGVNGGELTLCPTFIDVIKSVLSLPQLKNIYLITNGLLPDKLFQKLEQAKHLCDDKKVNLVVTLSVDGVDKVHEIVRGVPNCWQKTKRILDEFKMNPSKYATRVMIGCTLSQKNIAYAIQNEAFFANYPFRTSFHLAVPNKRIHTFDNAKDYYVLDDERSRLLAMEYFYYKFRTTKNNGKYSYFCQYYFLKNKRGRLTSCQYRYRDITIDETLKLYLCATASDILGDLNIISIKTAFKKNLKQVNKQVLSECDTCIHYISDRPTLRGLFLFYKEIIQTRFNWHNKFKILTKW